MSRNTGTREAATETETGVSAPDLIERYVERYAGSVGRVLIVLFMGFLWLPIFTVSLMSFAPGVLSFPPETLTTDWYVHYVTNDQAISATLTSLQISLIATPISVVLATLGAYGLERYVFRGKKPVQLLILLPIIVPLVVAGAGLMLFFSQLGLGRSYTSVVIAHVVRCIPFATLVILPAFMTFDSSMEEASLDLSANEIQTFFRVTLPNVYPGILAGGFLAFAISFNEFIYTYFIRDTGTETLPIYIWNQISHGATPEINVISVLFIVIAVLSVILAVLATNIERVATRER